MPLNTDDNALIEFNAPRHVGTSEETVEENRKQLLAHAASPLPYLDSIPAYASLVFSGSYRRSSRKEADLLIEMALAAVKRDDTDRAHQFIGYSLDIAETAQARSMLGELSLARGNEAAAIEEWKAALTIDPDHFFTLINLGKLYLMKQNVRESAPYLDRAIQIQPESARAHHLRGLAYQAAGDHKRASLEYYKSLSDRQYTDSIPTYYLNFGTALVQAGLYDEAKQMLEEYVSRAPADFDGHYQLGAVLEIQSERTLDDTVTRRAVDELKRALTIKPNHARAHYYLSKAYRRLEMYDEAEAEFGLYERLAP
jgi:Tfp pilus assembly protein PilF